MTTATNTIIGDIQLAGDLGGNNNGLAPALITTGVTAGSYTLPTLTIDAKGRVTAATSNTISSILPTATSSSLGIAQPDNTTITVSSGGIITAVQPPTATTSGLGLVKPDGTSVTVSSGTISVPTATTSVLGLVKPDGTSITISGGVISSTANPTATTSVLGLVKPDGTSVTVSSGTISVATATSSTLGLVKVDGTTVTASAGVLSVSGTNSAYTVAPYVITSNSGTTTVVGNESNMYQLNTTPTGNITINMTPGGGVLVVGTIYTFVIVSGSYGTYSVTLQLGGTNYDSWTPSSTYNIRRYIAVTTTLLKNIGTWS